MSFYRNYESMEDILVEHLNEVVEEYKKEKIEKDISENGNIYYGKCYMIHCFQFFYKHHEFINTLISCGMGDLYLAKITDYLIEKWVDKEKGTRDEVLRVCAYAGSIYNMYREWNKGDFQELPEDIAEILYDVRG